MKIRSDFVTNSSSSSFIFKEFHKEQVEEAVQRRLSIPPENKWEAMDYGWVKREIPYIIGKRFKEYEVRALMEVYDWYRGEILSEILGVEAWKSWDEHDRWKLEIKDNIHEKSHSDDIRRRITALFILDIYENYYWETHMWESRDKKMSVSLEFLNMQVGEYISSWNITDNVLHEFYLDQAEKLLAGAEEFDGMLIAEVMEFLFDAQYLYYSDMETHYLICDALKDAGLCLYACNHMG